MRGPEGPQGQRGETGHLGRAGPTGLQVGENPECSKYTVGFTFGTYTS